MSVTRTSRSIKGPRFRFSSPADLLSHLDHLKGCANARSTGSWSPAQILHRLATAFELSCQKRPAGQRKPWRLLKWPMRFVVLRGRIPRGRPMPPALRDALTPPDDARITEQLARLRQAISAFESVTHDLPLHPMLGVLTKDEWRRFHLRHGELHLGHIQLQDRVPQ